jgi:hypothetical protein
VKDTIKSVLSAVTAAFSGGADFESASSSLAKDSARFLAKHRVTVVVPAFSGAGTGRYVVYSRCAADRALLDRHEVHATDFDAFDVAEAGEVLNLLVDGGYHRIHAVPLPAGAKKGWLGTQALLAAVPRDPEDGALLFDGDVSSDVGLA